MVDTQLKYAMAATSVKDEIVSTLQAHVTSVQGSGGFYQGEEGGARRYTALSMFLTKYSNLVINKLNEGEYDADLVKNLRIVAQLSRELKVFRPRLQEVPITGEMWNWITDVSDIDATTLTAFTHRLSQSMEINVPAELKESLVEVRITELPVPVITSKPLPSVASFEVVDEHVQWLKWVSELSDDPEYVYRSKDDMMMYISFEKYNADETELMTQIVEVFAPLYGQFVSKKMFYTQLESHRKKHDIAVTKKEIRRIKADIFLEKIDYPLSFEDAVDILFMVLEAYVEYALRLDGQPGVEEIRSVLNRMDNVTLDTMMFLQRSLAQTNYRGRSLHLPKNVIFTIFNHIGASPESYIDHVRSSVRLRSFKTDHYYDKLFPGDRTAYFDELEPREQKTVLKFYEATADTNIASLSEGLRVLVVVAREAVKKFYALHFETQIEPIEVSGRQMLYDKIIDHLSFGEYIVRKTINDLSLLDKDHSVYDLVITVMLIVNIIRQYIPDVSRLEPYQRDVIRELTEQPRFMKLLERKMVYHGIEDIFWE